MPRATIDPDAWAETEPKQEAPNLGGRPGYDPPDWHFHMAEELAGIGVPEADVGRILGISHMTVSRYLGDAMQLGRARYRAACAGKLREHIFKHHSFPALQFYMRTQMRWVEAKEELADTNDDVTQMDDDALQRELDALDQVQEMASQARAVATRVSR